MTMQKNVKIGLISAATVAVLAVAASVAYAERGAHEGGRWGHRMEMMDGQMGMMGGQMDGRMGMMGGQMDGRMGMMDGQMGGRMGGHGMRGAMMGAAIDFTAADADKDGKVTAAELTAWQAATTAAVDANADGKLSADEISAAEVKALTTRLQDHATQMVAAMDTDGDSLLSAAELLAGPHGVADFTQLDRNGDGALTADELAPAVAPAAAPAAAPVAPAAAPDAAPAAPAAPATGSTTGN
jgi:EF hand